MNIRNRVWSIVPVKRFAIAKSRLSPMLDAEERAMLARLMFEDVLDVLMQSKAVLAGVAVVTSDKDGAALACSRGAAVVPDRDGGGINAAVRLAITQVVGEDDGVMVVPSDIPQVTSDTIAAVAEAVALPGAAAIVGSHDGGTNLLACRPAGAIPLHYGPHSFERHCRAAAQAGLTVESLRVPQLLLDIDSPEDIRRFVALNTRTRTHEFLSRQGISDSLESGNMAVGRIAAGAPS